MKRSNIIHIITKNDRLVCPFAFRKRESAEGWLRWQQENNSSAYIRSELEGAKITELVVNR